MLVPHVLAGADAAATLAKLSVIHLLFAELSRGALEALATTENATLSDAQAALKRALLASRTIAGPFAHDMMGVAISWLDQGVRKVLVDAASMEDSELQRVATAVSELPANRVVLRLPLDADALVADPAGVQDKIKRLQDSIGGVVLRLRSSNADVEDEAAFQSVATALKTVRGGFDEGFFFAVELVQVSESSFDHAILVPRIAELHHKGIHLVAPALPRTSDEQRTQFVDAGLAFVKCIRSDRPDGLITTVVADEAGVALGLVYSSEESILSAIESGRGVYYSRSRKGLWKKGESSGNVQQLVQLDLDCDSDALRFTVAQTGAGFCHLNTRTCWGESGGLQHLQSVLESRLKDAPEGSYTKRLFSDPVLLRNKLVEEAQELAEAETVPDVAGEAADVLYFALVRCVAAGATLADVERTLDMRSLKVKRRPGNSKAYRIEAANEILNQPK